VRKRPLPIEVVGLSSSSLSSRQRTPATRINL
jgi:hypothetical protein